MNNQIQPLNKSLNIIEHNKINIDKINSALQQARDISANVNDFGIQLKIAEYIKQIHESLDDDCMTTLMFLQNKSIGFLTDKFYPEEVVKNCIVEAMIRGLRPVGNEFNILAGRFYATKEGLQRLLYSHPNVEKVEIKNEPVKNAQTSNWAVTFKGNISLKDGNKILVDQTFRISGTRGNFEFGIDVILGKAHRKLYKELVQQLNNNIMAIPDGDIHDDGGNEKPGYSTKNGEKVSKIKQLNNNEQKEEKDATT